MCPRLIYPQAFRDSRGNGSPGKSQINDDDGRRIADLLIGNAAERIIRILALEVNHELREFMVMAKEVDRILWSGVSTGKLEGKSRPYQVPSTQ